MGLARTRIDDIAEEARCVAARSTATSATRRIVIVQVMLRRRAACSPMCCCVASTTFLTLDKIVEGVVPGAECGNPRGRAAVV